MLQVLVMVRGMVADVTSMVQVWGGVKCRRGEELYNDKAQTDDCMT